MPTYKYVAVDLQKRKYKGIFIAEDENDLAVQLTKQNLYLVSSSLLFVLCKFTTKNSIPY